MVEIRFFLNGTSVSIRVDGDRIDANGVELGLRSFDELNEVQREFLEDDFEDTEDDDDSEDSENEDDSEDSENEDDSEDEEEHQRQKYEQLPLLSRWRYVPQFISGGN